MIHTLVYIPIFQIRGKYMPRKILYNVMLLSLVVTARANSDDSLLLTLSGHSHNDYQHARPLWDAIENKFISIEADIHLVGETLLVGHDPDDLDVHRTLQSLYLIPLRAYIHDHHGWVYPGVELILLIDIKTAAESTYEVLHRELAANSDILTTYLPDSIVRRAVSVIISGNRPRALMSRQTIRYATYDGRLEDLSGEISSNFMILISDNWAAHFAWRGTGPLSAADRKKLLELVTSAHAKGYKIRFWNLPVNDPSCRKTVWTELLSSGVDLLSVDDLKAYHDFLIDDYRK
jgi:hypothetical protein